MSKIEQIIAEIEEYIDNCKLQPLSSTKIIVNRNELEELIDDLKENVPDEIKKYQRIIANRDAILKDAQDKAEEMIKKANEMTAQLVSEHEIMQQAYREASGVIENANEESRGILERANAEADALRTATNQYLDDSLGMIQSILSSSINDLSANYESIIRSLQSELDITTQNRNSFQDSRRQSEAYEEQIRNVDEPQTEADDGEYGDLSGSLSVAEALNQSEFNMDDPDGGLSLI